MSVLERMSTEDLERFEDRLTHAEQYLAESRKAVEECKALAAKAAKDDDDDQN